MDRVILGIGKVGAGINIKQMPLFFPKSGNLGSEKFRYLLFFFKYISIGLKHCTRKPHLLRRLKQEDHNFKVSLDYRVTLRLTGPT